MFRQLSTQRAIHFHRSAIYKSAILPLLLITSLLTACGFQLRGQMDIASELSELSVSGSDRTFVRDLRRALTLSGISMNDDAPYRLVVTRINQDSEQRSQSAAGSYDRLLTLSVTYQLETDDGLKLFAPMELRNERFFTQNQNQSNASSNEERIIFNELRQDIISSTVRRVAAMSGDALRQETERAREVRKQELEALEARE
ncbi:hypothetical protein GZ77_11700 [Endozoicomonas montiporae]|uniref:LPS-assembly lipoprotein LptE n=2 Tax=Endozoicomonas montiporae TaxID=1027273 RepID=A0A081N8Z1_9GAMM|nr:hypothetical protein [Endozoicomonas montiporae]AMO55161.1 LPS-assembly lipoprotein [Endozoicomonas montiporae CL-33]KEQ14914.1 hypothetical protein GZ77_11700 [Endozoicomonas montiporae]